MFDDCAMIAMLVGPQQGAVGVIDETVAVGAEDRHLAGGIDQRRLQFAAGAVGLEKTGSEADRAAAADVAQALHDLDGELAVDADKGGVGRAG